MTAADSSTPLSPATTNVRVLRAIRDEEQPNYDAEHTAARQPERVTFRMVPDPILDLQNPYATQVYAHLLRLARSSDQCTVSYDALGTLCGMSDKQVRRVILLLEQHGFLYVEQRRDGGMKLPNRYILCGHKTPNAMDRTHSPNVGTHSPIDRTDVPLGREPQSQRRDSQSHLLLKETTLRDNERVNPPTPLAKPTSVGTQKNDVPSDEDFQRFIALYPEPKQEDQRYLWQEWRKLDLDPASRRWVLADLERLRKKGEFDKGRIPFQPKAGAYLREKRWQSHKPFPFMEVADTEITPKQRQAQTDWLDGQSFY